MRVLAVDPGVDYSVSDVHQGIISGLRANGCTVGNFATSDRLAVLTHARLKNEDGEERHAFRTFDDTLAIANEMLRGAIYAAKPDLVLVTSGFFINEISFQLMRARGQKVCAVMTEQPYELGRELRIAELVDYVALNDPTHIEKFRERCPNVWYRPHAFDPKIHHPRGRTDDVDAVWIGTAYPSRIKFMEQVDWSGINLQLGGNFQDLGPDSSVRRFLIDQVDDESCVDNRATANWMRRAKTTWNTYRKEAETAELSAGWAMGPREVEAAATRCFMARESRPEGDELFPMLPIVSDPAELGDVLRWALANPDARDDATLKAAEAVADRTFDASAAELLSRCGF